MGFSDKAKLTALAIVHVFETSRPFGGYGALVVLDDGAGVSYGVSQFTHRSGSLLKVVNTYLGMGGTVGAAVLKDRMHLLMDSSWQAIHALANDRQFKDALKFAAATDEMHEAQNQIAENFYLTPAISACEGSGFVCPLSLAVVYDSINHGSWAAIRDRVDSTLPEKKWITEYVRRRHEWLRSKPKLKVTSYRTSFFLDEILDGNWDLDLPIYPHGTAITDEMIPDNNGQESVLGGQQEDSAVEPVHNPPASNNPPVSDPVTNDPAKPTDLAQLPIGDAPDAKPSAWFDVEDWKPMVTRWLTRIWTSITGLNVTQGSANLIGIFKDPEHWVLYVVIAAIVLFLSIGAAVIVSIVLLGIWLWNRREILHLKATQLAAMADPNKKNIGLIFERK